MTSLSVSKWYLMFHFSFHNIIGPNQYGFRLGRDTTDCLVDLIKEINKTRDSGEFAELRAHRRHHSYSHEVIDCPYVRTHVHLSMYDNVTSITPVYRTPMLLSIDTCQNKVSADQ